MLRVYRLRLVYIFFVFIAVLLLAAANVRLAAQGTTGTILGTVTDSSGGVVPDAMVQVTNVGTGAAQTVTSDAQGRYRAPDLPVGDYRISTQKAGFESVVHTGITLSPGANIVVDFALPVGQVTQAVTVEGNVTQVETTSAAISTVVEPTQMRDLPLNGRNFEELILLAPGVANNHASNINVSGVATFAGTSNWWSVSGSRSNGQGELLDGTNIQNYQDRGSGSGVLGTSLGVDSIAEFQLLTNTYGAQYGGNGSVVNSVTRSGTNDLHGSAYEFIRNSALDARNFTDATRQPYRRNQFGGTLGGPIKKDKMFFFVNYEGIRQSLGQSVIETVPDSYTLQGLLPSTVTGGVPASCTNVGAINPAYPTILYSNCGAGSVNAAKFAVVQPFLNLYNPVVAGFNMSEVTNTTGTPTGTAQIHDSAQQPGREDYVVGRYDWTISSNDSIFSRYLLDTATLTEPFATIPQYPQHDRTRNQFETIGEKHIFSTNVINAFNMGYTRTFLDLHSPGQAGNILNFNGTDIYSPVYGSDAPTEGAVSPGGGVVGVGPNQTAPIQYAQTKFGPSDDVFWTKGAHSLRIGGSAYRIQTNGLHAFPGIGTWTFSNIPSFFTDVPQQFSGPCNYANGEPGCVSAAGTPFPLPSSRHDMRETQFSMYVQDDWKLSSTLTLNLGVRYEPTSNPWDALHQIYLLVPVPLGSNGNLPPATANGTPVPSTFTPENNFLLKNPSLHNFDPRIGLAWDPFKDHKTSVRAGYGIFHTVLQARDYSYGAFYSFPWLTSTQTAPAVLNFPTPAQSPVSSATSITYGTSPFATTPYLQQWNLSVQREIMKNTVVTVAYVGSHGVHLIAQADENAPALTGALTEAGSGAACGLASGAACGGISLTGTQTLWPSFTGQLQSLKSVSGSPAVYNPANGTVTCAAGCTLASPNGQPIIDPTTGQPAFSHIVQTGATYSVASNTHLDPYFSFLESGGTDTYSFYNALQAGLVRRMSNNFSLQISYTYSDCVDISSGSWGAEGGTNNPDPYNLNVDRGPCNFMVRQNVTTNGLYQFPFKRNQLVAGWQLGGVMYFSTGAPFSVETYSLGTTDIGSGANNHADYLAGNPGCNSQPLNFQVTGTGVFYVNPNCFAEPPIGELGNLGRNAFFQPDIATFNANLQKNTRVNERLNIQFRVEAFNLLNRKNFTFQGQTAVSLTQQGTTSAAAAGTGITTSSFGQFLNVIGYPLNGSARQLQFGLKFIF